MGKYEAKRKKKTRLSGFSVMMLVLLVCAVGLCTFVWAKYASDQKMDTQVSAKAFYFESDLLNGGTHTLPAGTKKLSFLLMNYPDALRTSEVDIQYTAKLLQGSTAVKEESGTLEIAEGEETVTFDISGLSAGTYTLRCSATAPYAKTLSATFKILPADPSVEHTVADGAGNPVCYLTVTVGDYNGPISITWPAGVTPDPQDPAAATMTLKSNSEYQFTFFKSNITKVYKDSDFSVEKSAD